ncbi:MAG: translation termination inhibitor protein itt1 [Sclerophora amabilis]|nr:MAG: translation termination inhibitor protein itt1 [Sclerophora amabilis]
MADDLDSSVGDERETELNSIAAIFPELTFDPANKFSASIDIAVTPAKPLAVVFPSLSDWTPAIGLPSPPTSDDEPSVQKALHNSTDGETNRLRDTHQLSHLPPLSLQLSLPDGYPAKRGPTIGISTRPSWLPSATIARLITEGQKLWEELGRDQVIFSYIDHLQQSAERSFDIVNAESDGRIALTHDLKTSLLDFDVKAKRAKFQEETFQCGICLDPKKGSSCHRLWHCSHVFCTQCLQDFYNNCITEGDIHSVKCLDPKCGKDANEKPPAEQVNLTPRRKKRRKEDRRLSPSELLEIKIEPDTVKRYVTLKRKAEIEADMNTVYCPRKWCQGAARYQRPLKASDDAVDSTGDSDIEEEEIRTWKNGDSVDTMPPPAERVAICEECSYAFCRVCLAGWHGELTTCWPRSHHELTAEEKASEEYMEKHSSRCPTCSARCQKTMGCNHMICFNCRSHFCYLCSAWLEAGDPYKHFNRPFLGCYMRLWELEQGDGVDVGPANVLPGVQGDDHEVDDVFGAFRLPQRPAALQDNQHRVPDEVVIPPIPTPQVAAAAPPVVARGRQGQRNAAAPARPHQRLQELERNLEVAGQQLDNLVRQMGHLEADLPAARNRRDEQEDGRVRVRDRIGEEPFPVAGRPREPQQQPAPQARGIRRFLEMAQNDEEDEWDSDEFDDDEDPHQDWEIPVR